MKIMAGFSLLLVAACASPQQTRMADMRASEERMDAICDASVKNPILDPIRDKMPSKISKATIAQLSDASMPNDQEKAVLLAMDDVIAECRSAQIKNIEMFGAPGTSAALLNLFQREKMARAALWQGKITFGQYNTARSESSAEFVQSANAAVQSARQAQAQDDAARRAAALQYLSSRPQPSIQPIVPYVMPTSRPIQTNCIRNGATTNCTSY